MLFVETFHIISPVVEKRKCQGLGSIFVGYYSVVYKRKFMLLVLYFDLQNQVQVASALPDALYFYRMGMDGLIHAFRLWDRGDYLPKRIGGGVGVINRCKSADYPISRIRGKFVGAVPVLKMPYLWHLWSDKKTL